MIKSSLIKKDIFSNINFKPVIFDVFNINNKCFIRGSNFLYNSQGKTTVNISNHTPKIYSNPISFYNSNNIYVNTININNINNTTKFCNIPVSFYNSNNISFTLPFRINSNNINDKQYITVVNLHNNLDIGQYVVSEVFECYFTL